MVNDAVSLQKYDPKLREKNLMDSLMNPLSRVGPTCHERSHEIPSPSPVPFFPSMAFYQSALV